MTPHKHTIWQAFKYSWQGLKAAYVNEAAFRKILLSCLILTPFGIWIGHTGVEYALLFGSLLLVIIVELLNSGIEAAIDRIGPEHHELSGRAKDMGSAATMGAMILVGVVWGCILLF